MSGPAEHMGGAPEEEAENSLCGRDSEIGHAGPSEAHLPENGAHWSASETRLVCGFKNASN